jgi:hypothetical protein
MYETLIIINDNGKTAIANFEGDLLFARSRIKMKGYPGRLEQSTL